MSDLISRQDAINAIVDLPNCYNGFSDTYDKAYIIGTLEEVPSAVDCKKCIFKPFKNVPSAEPEIIRCKDCKYASPNGKYGCKAYHFKLYETHEMNADDFCSRAERRK